MKITNKEVAKKENFILWTFLSINDPSLFPIQLKYSWKWKIWMIYDLDSQNWSSEVYPGHWWRSSLSPHWQKCPGCRYWSGGQPQLSAGPLSSALSLLPGPRSSEQFHSNQSAEAHSICHPSPKSCGRYDWIGTVVQLTKCRFFSPGSCDIPFQESTPNSHPSIHNT